MEGCRSGNWLIDIYYISSLESFMESDFDIEKVALLARLELTEAEIKEFGGQLGQILGYIEQLKQIDVEGIEPTAHAAAVYNVYREDVEQTDRFLTQEEALANAPETAHDQVKMPKVIE